MDRRYKSTAYYSDQVKEWKNLSNSHDQPSIFLSLHAYKELRQVYYRGAIKRYQYSRMNKIPEKKRHIFFKFAIELWLKKTCLYIWEKQSIMLSILRFRSYSKNLSASFLHSGYNSYIDLMIHISLGSSCQIVVYG